MPSPYKVRDDLIFYFVTPATTEIYSLSLHDALPIWTSYRSSTRRAADRPSPPASSRQSRRRGDRRRQAPSAGQRSAPPARSEEHTSEPSHVSISYAVFCLKKKKTGISSMRGLEFYDI